ncbi:unnamed protein product (macronuclear) [Paramecium tetraurelia]|uniref:Thioredoxin domain-containing protein n=1 Tax=Paramecium tetraurelia TaxID=5888 RepID=A0D542_PARTE|nr:uncharacterized protein GSPATT00013606001 [Paramecium tetraurelia]CAK78159.1 unnamed protein product [Paramecium tetraurelia]|eukprot:XP_001445556.1 hypothetical protein (macronuclear) [Paramecium tetraurelia strain d4-2]
MYIYLILISLVLTIYGVEKSKLFSYRIIALKDYDFFNQLQIDKKMEKPWLVFFFMEHEENSKEFIPIFDKLAEEFKTTNMYFSAVDIYENEDVRDRIVISKFPQLIYFDMNSLMYRYNGELTFESVSNFVRNEEWNQLQGKKVPKEINYWKRTLRKLTGFVAILIYSIIFTIIAVIWYFQNRSHSILLKKIRRIDIAQSNILEKKKKYMKIE